jgi:RimJ/RimL family protein N-acetyltransferase
MACPVQVERERYEFRLDSSPDENILAAVYLLLNEDDLLRLLFYEYPVGLRQFLDFGKLPNSRYFVAYAVSHMGHTEIAGFGVAWNITGPEGAKRADVGIAFLRKFWGYAERCMFMAVQHLFDSGVAFLYAITPAHNRLSQALIRRVGFTILGPLPGWYTCEGQRDAVIGYLEKSKWRGPA